MSNNIRRAALILLIASSANAFSPAVPSLGRDFALRGISDDTIESAIERAAEYQPGMANTEFARRFASLKGAEIRTVGEAFADFTKILGIPVNALYKNMMTDIVGTTHLTAVNARFKRDGIWSLGMLTALDLLLKNYPEQDAIAKIKSSLFECVGMEEAEIKDEAKAVADWVEGKSREDIAAALTGAGDSPLSAIANDAKADEFWMYSRFFGIGLVTIMEKVGCASNADDVFPVMEEWMGSMGKSHFTACSDSDQYFKIKSKLDLMETMMKEIEIREKKRMAQRLEEKAEAAIAAAEREAEFAKETQMEAVEKEEPEKVEAKIE